MGTEAGTAGDLLGRLRGRNLLDGVVLVVAFWAAYLLRFEFAIPAEAARNALIQTPFVVGLQILILRHYGVHRMPGRYVSFGDLNVFVWSAAMWLVPMLGLRVILPDGPWRIPISVTLMDTVLAVVGVLGVRVAQRFHAEVLSVAPSSAEKMKRVLLVGAGSAGAQVAKELSKRNSELRVVGYVDDDPNKHGSVIAGASVYGGTEEIPVLVDKHEVDQVIITIADPSPDFMQRIVAICETVPVRARSIPSFVDIVQGRLSITAFQDVGVEDLLGRDTVSLDTDAEVAELIGGRVVMVTGAGGSIGSELARQVADLDPAMLLLVERAEGALFEINRELSQTYPAARMVPLVADIADALRMQSIFDQYRPNVVVHAAAHKHVTMMEENPEEAIKNNTLATQLIAEMAGEGGVDCFVQVSTDKAVRPASIMGASKRLAEMVVQRCDDLYSDTRYVAVRFGNVMGSSGSVIPIFKEQVRRGGPVTVTHEEATRYFMTIPEASRLVLAAAAIGEGGEIMVLDMGEPVRIVDLARNLIRLSGYMPDHDISIEITGLGRGEKVSEELYSETEDMETTRHPKIFVGKSTSPNGIAGVLDELESSIASGSDEQLRKVVHGAIDDSRMYDNRNTPPPPHGPGAPS